MTARVVAARHAGGGSAVPDDGGWGHGASGHAGLEHDDLTGWALAVVVLLVLVVPYVWAAASVRAAGRRWPARRTWWFLVGAAVVGVAVSPLVWPTAGGAARAHMMQHVAVGMMAPLALVVGAPVTLALASLPMDVRRTIVRALASTPVRMIAHPVAAATLHVGGLFALYLTPLYAATMDRPVLHHLVLMHFLAAGCLFAWSLVGPEREARRPGTATRVVVLVAASAAHGYLAKLLYARAPALPTGNRHGTADLQDAAQWMYYAGDLTELALATALFAAWYRRSRRRAPAPQVAVVRPG